MLTDLLGTRSPGDVVAIADDGAQPLVAGVPPLVGAGAQPLVGAGGLAGPAAQRVEVRAGDLRDRVLALTAALGDVRGRTVLVACRRPLRALEASLAVLEAGGAVVPVNLRQPPEAQDRLRAATAPAATIDDAGVTRLDGSKPIDPRVGLVLATSGSSGSSHLVQLGRDGLLANVDAILGYLPLRTFRRPAITLPFWYSYALVGQAFAGLRAGATLLLLGDEPWPIRQLAAMRAHDADGLSSVPGGLRSLADAALDAPAGERPRLRYLASAGEPLDARVIARVREAFPGARLFNQYGLTEASPRVAAISDADPGFDAGAAGYPLAGVRVVVAHADGRPCTEADPAEIRVRGPSIMIGYLDDPDATARVLRDGELFTGDLGWTDAEGRLHVVARKDDVVKISGERVSLVGIEHVLVAHPGTDEVVVLAYRDPENGTRIAACARTADPDGLRRWARDRLPPASRPHRWIVLDAIPRNANGKIDRTALRSLVSPVEAA